MGEIVINKVKNKLKPKIKFDDEFEEVGGIFYIDIVEDEDLSLVLKDKKFFEESAKEYLKEASEQIIGDNIDVNSHADFIKYMNKYRKKLGYTEIIATLRYGNCVDYIEEILKNFNDLFNLYDTVILEIDKHDVVELLKNNPMILGCDIHIEPRFSITDEEILQDLAKLFPRKLNNIYINLTGNVNKVTLRNALETIKKIKKEAIVIEKNDFSPIEKIMYAYDIVRDRVYMKNDGRYFLSRDLSEILFNDPIVCVGYIQHFKAILEYLGIKCYDILLHPTEDGKPGHQRAGIYIVDKKYNIDGFYYFDPTNDSKTSSDDDTFRTFYKYFAKTNFQFKRKDKGKWKETYMTEFDETFISRYTEVSNSRDDNLRHRYINTARSILEYTNNKNKYNDPQFMGILFEDLVDAVDKMNREIDGDTLFEVFKVVRKAQYNTNRELYPYNKDELQKVYRKNWSMIEDRVLKSIFGIYETEDRNKKINDDEIKRVRIKFKH